MPATNMELVRRFFDTYCSGDYDGSLACVDPEVVYEVTQEAPARGREAVRAIWERWESSFDRARDGPGGVHRRRRARGRARFAITGRGRGSGVEFDQLSYDVCTVRDGLVVRKREFAERADALRAVGLSS